MSSAPEGSTRALLLCWCALSVLLTSVIVCGQDPEKLESKPPEAKQEIRKPEISANELVRETVAHEVAAANDTSVKHMFRSRRQTAKGSQTRLYVETNDSMAGMLIAINDQPLNAQQVQGELGHLDWLLNNPDQLRKKRAREKEDADRTMRIAQTLYEGVSLGGDPVGLITYMRTDSLALSTEALTGLRGLIGKEYPDCLPYVRAGRNVG